MPHGMKRDRNYTEEYVIIAAKIADYECKIKTLRSQMELLQIEQEHSHLHSLNKLMNENLN